MSHLYKDPPLNISQKSCLNLIFRLKLHHLIGTKTRPGVVTAIDRKHQTAIEKMIKCLEFTVYVENKKLQKFTCEETNNCTEPMLLCGTRFERCERAIRDYEKRVRKSEVSRKRSKRERIEKVSSVEDVILFVVFY